MVKRRASLWNWMVAAMVSAVLVAGGGNAAAAGSEGPRFSGERAMALLEELCAVGPRVPGTKAHAAARDLMVERLTGLADRVELEEFPAASPPYAPGIGLTNIVARFGPGRSPRVLVGAHWDSRPHADEDPDPSRRLEPVLGANDGAAGCALMLHLAELLHRQAPGMGVDLVFFDGEDGGIQDSLSTYCLGSREHVRRLKAPRPAYVIVLDMIGDRDLNLHAEGYSMTYAPDLVRTVWGRAAALGITEFKLDVRHHVYDDHLPFLEAGIPAIDIIDFDYPHWHTVADTPDKCSAASLSAVGEVMVSLLYDP